MASQLLQYNFGLLCNGEFWGKESTHVLIKAPIGITVLGSINGGAEVTATYDTNLESYLIPIPNTIGMNEFSFYAKTSSSSEKVEGVCRRINSTANNYRILYLYTNGNLSLAQGQNTNIDTVSNRMKSGSLPLTYPVEPFLKVQPSYKPSTGGLSMYNLGIVLQGSTIQLETVTKYGTGDWSTSGYSFSFQVPTIPIPEQIQIPLISGDVKCSTTQISGTSGVVDVNTKATLYKDTLILKEVSVVSSGMGSSFSFTGLDLTTRGGEQLTIVLSNSTQDPSTPLYITVGTDSSCVIPTLDQPVVTSLNLCKKKCDYQRKLVGTSDFVGDVIVFEAPFTINSKPVAAGFSNGTTWEVSSSKIKPKVKYMAYGIRYDGIDDGFVQLNEVQSCDSDCVMCGTFKGTTGNVDKGIIRVYEAPMLPNSQAVAISAIVDSQFDIKMPLDSGKDYILYSIKLEI